ncbi:hypothetical protein DJ72_14295 [Halorubrum distributum]|nr:hypothetical protein DJ72_14295 [Halorubrum distributum]
MQPVERAEYEGVDYAWVMQTTFVVTILVGAPAAALLSTLVTLESWGARAAFAVRVGAPIWFVTAVAVAGLGPLRVQRDGGAGTDDDAAPDEEADSDEEADLDEEADSDDDGDPTEDGEPTTNESGKRD